MIVDVDTLITPYQSKYATIKPNRFSYDKILLTVSIIKWCVGHYLTGITIHNISFTHTSKINMYINYLLFKEFIFY